MSDRIYNLNDIIRKLEESVDYYQTELDLWEKVTRNHKKDSGDFENLSKNFNNAKIQQENYEPSDYKEICVYGRNKKGYCQTYSIKCYEYEETENTKAKIEYETWRKPIYILTVDGIFDRIAKRIEMDRNYIDNLQKQIEIAPQIYDKVCNCLTTLHDVLENDTKCISDKYGTSSLRYALRDYIITNVK